MKNRTLKKLSCQNEKIYVYLSNETIANKFMTQATEEGFLFADGAKPTERECAMIMAVNSNLTINFVGIIGAIAFGAGAKYVGEKELKRIDFEKYIAGEENYDYTKKH